MQRPLIVFIAVGIVLCMHVTGCASLPSTPSESQPVENPDPLENINRPMDKMNNFLDRHIGEPIADGYVKVIPPDVRLSVSNFFDNLGYLNVILHDFLQGKGQQGFQDSSRFLVNTTAGIGGLFDVATLMGLEAHNEDFGQTLGTWGADKGAYLVLPVFGPDTVRNVPDIVTSAATNIFFYVATPVIAPLAVLKFVDRRARADQAIRFRDESAVEPYLFTREAYLQHRRFLVYDGNPPMKDLFLDESYVEDGSLESDSTLVDGQK